MVEPGYELDRDKLGLTKQERAVLRRLEKGGLRHADIAKELGVTRQRVSQIVASLRKKGAWNG